MMGEKVAIRYARALYEIAAENSQIKEYGLILNQVVKTVGQNNDLQQFLITPHIPIKAKKEILAQIFSDIPSVMLHFLYLLVDKKRESIMVAILKEYQKIVDEKTGALECFVTTATSLKSAEEEALKKRLEEISGRVVRMVKKEDSAILGGLLIQIGNRRVDGSVRGRLHSLAEALVKPI